MTEKTQTVQRNASIIQKGLESVQRMHPTSGGTEIHAKNASNIRNGAGPKESRRAIWKNCDRLKRKRTERTTDNEEDP